LPSEETTPPVTKMYFTVAREVSVPSGFSRPRGRFQELPHALQIGLGINAYGIGSGFGGADAMPVLEGSQLLEAFGRSSGVEGNVAILRRKERRYPYRPRCRQKIGAGWPGRTYGMALRVK
jgi:hypothetical protein